MSLSLIQVQATAARSPNCVVWHSQHKSGGLVMESIISHRKAADVIRPDVYRCDVVSGDENWNCKAQECMHGIKADRKNDRVAIRGYTPVLEGRPEWSHDKCTWVTMSREPIARLVSAAFYCKYDKPGDPLCGRTRIDAQTATIRDWAKHWGNYLFRELLWFPDLHAHAKSRRDFGSDFNCTDAPWLQLKDQLKGGDDPRTRSGRKNLAAVKERLGGKGPRLYDVHGVLEKWNDTMKLFDHHVPLVVGTWAERAAGRTGHRSDMYKAKEQEALKHARGDDLKELAPSSYHRDGHISHLYDAALADALEEARKDPEVVAELAADIELYDMIVKNLDVALLGVS